jgi:putative methionine-R-sulfoxide reductase with GAF domain
MLREELIPHIQRRVPEFQSLFSELFRSLLSETNADEGFLAFEDLNGNLAIAANKGDFWYLSRDAGATGRAVTSGTPIIIKDPSGDNKFKETGGRVQSELIYPIKYKETPHVIGAILLDNLKKVDFEDTDLRTVGKYVAQICDALGDENPWNFRTWWQNQQKLKRKALLDRVHETVQSVLDRPIMEDGAAAIEGRVESITHDGNLVLHRSVLGKYHSARKSDRDLVGKALRTGKQVNRPAESRKDECLIPFPLNQEDGPVLGIVTLITPQDKELPAQILDDLMGRLRMIPYQHYAPVLPGERQGAEHYFSLVLTALTAPTSPKGATDALKKLARQARALCGEDIQIHVSFDGEAVAPKAEDVVVTTREAITRELNAREPIERFYCHTGHEWLSCPIFVRETLRGIVKVKNNDISNIYNSDMVVVIAILVGALLDRVRE